MACTGLPHAALLSRCLCCRRCRRAGRHFRNPRLGVRTPADLIEALERQPGRYTYGTPGVGSAQHLAMTLLGAISKTSAVHIHHRGAGALAQDLSSGSLDLALLSTSSAMPLIRSGRAVAIATTAAHRTEALPDVPALAEHPTLRGFDMTAWMALFAPAHLPQDVRSRLQHALQEALAAPAVLRAVADSGTTACGHRSRRPLARRTAKTARIVREAGIRP